MKLNVIEKMLWKLLFALLLVVAFVNSECPEENGESPHHYKHESDCSSFYKCDNGIAYEMKCPDGLRNKLKDELL